MRRSSGSIQAQLGAIVLTFELVVIGLASLTLLGLRAIPTTAGGPWSAIWYGSAVAALGLVAIVLQRGSFGAPAGWLVQVIIFSGGLFQPSLYLVGMLFAAIWGYATLAGARIDAQLRKTKPHLRESHQQPFEQKDHDDRPD